MRSSPPNALLLAGLVTLAAIGTPARAQNPPASQPAAPAQAAAPPQRDQTTIRAEVNLVDMVFAVVNHRQKFITDLEKENFSVYEDGQPQKITNFNRQTDLPLRVGLLLDTSNSIRDRLKFEQEAAIDFLYNIIRRHKDQAFLMTFDNEPSVVQDFTEDVGALRDAILRQRAGGVTALYDAICAAGQRLLSSSPRPATDNPDVRRVLVVISDGDDNSSLRSRGEALEMIQRAGVAIYAISTSTKWVSATVERDPVKRLDRKYHKDEGDKVLEQFAEETGGRVFFPYHVDDLAQSFLDIGDELRSQYSLAYVPTNRAADAKFRRIRIDVDRKGLHVRARKGYFAPRAAADPAKPTSKPPGS